MKRTSSGAVAAEIYIFVYGTLLPDEDGKFCIHIDIPNKLKDELESIVSEQVCKTSLPGVLYDFGEYPGAQFKQELLKEGNVPQDAASVQGQLLKIRAVRNKLSIEKILRVLDEYELADHAPIDEILYRRSCLPVFNYSESRWCEAWVYEILDSALGSAEVISSGIWDK